MSSPSPSLQPVTFREEVFQDAARIWKEDRPSLRDIAGALLRDFGLSAAIFFRLARRLHRNGHPLLTALVNRVNLALNGCYLSANAEIGPGLRLAHPWGVAVGEGVRAGKDLVLFQHVSLAARRWVTGDYPSMGDGVIIYSHSVVLGAVHLGDGCRVGACSLVLHDVPAGVTVAGMPAVPVSGGPEKCGPGTGRGEEECRSRPASG